MVTELFTGHPLSVNGLNVLQRAPADKDWIFGSILFICLLLAWVRVNFARRLVQQFNAISSNIHYTELVREMDLPASPDSLSMNAVFILSLSLFAYLVSTHFGWTFSDTGGILFFFKISVFFLCLYVLKMLIIKIVGIILDIRHLAGEYLFNVLLLHKLMGVLLLPLILLVTYSVGGVTIALYTGIGIIISIFATCLFRLFIILRKDNTVGVFYPLMALLILEVLPLMILIKIFSGIR